MLKTIQKDTNKKRSLPYWLKGGIVGLIIAIVIWPTTFFLGNLFNFGRPPLAEVIAFVICGAIGGWIIGKISFKYKLNGKNVLRRTISSFIIMTFLGIMAFCVSAYGMFPDPPVPSKIIYFKCALIALLLKPLDFLTGLLSGETPCANPYDIFSTLSGRAWNWTKIQNYLYGRPFISDFYNALNILTGFVIIFFLITWIISKIKSQKNHINSRQPQT